MEKNKETGFYEVMLPLERKKYNFKFIIDGEWLCSDLYQTTYDEHNNLNNFIDLTKIYQSEIKKEKNTNKKDERIKIKVKNIYDEEVKNNNSITSKKEDKKKFYNSNYPLFNDLNTIAPTIMEPYKLVFKLDSESRQNNLKKFRKYLNYKENNFNTENNTYKKIMVWPHTKLLHFCSNLEDIGNINLNYCRTCVTNRNAHKFLTFIYYKPK